MNDQDKKEIGEYLKKLPQNIKKLIANDEWRKKVGEISQKYSLTTEQSESLENEVLMVIIGLTQAEEFKNVLQEEIQISDLIADQLSKELDKRVFEYMVKELEAEHVVSLANTMKKEELASAKQAQTVQKKESELPQEPAIKNDFLRELGGFKPREEILQKKVTEVEIAPNVLPAIDADVRPVEAVQAEKTVIPPPRYIPPAPKPQTETPHEKLVEKPAEKSPDDIAEKMRNIWAVSDVPHNLPGMEIAHAEEPNSAPQKQAEARKGNTPSHPSPDPYREPIE